MTERAGLIKRISISSVEMFKALQMFKSLNCDSWNKRFIERWIFSQQAATTKLGKSDIHRFSELMKFIQMEQLQTERYDYHLLNTIR